MEYLLKNVVHRINILDARTRLVTMMCGATAPLGDGGLVETPTDRPPCAGCITEYDRRTAKWEREHG